jgi:hypothetical protein
LLLWFFHISSLFFTTSFSSLLSASAMGKGNKRKREPTPPSEDFGDSEYSEEEFSSESEGPPTPVSPPASSGDSDDSQGIAAEVWTYIRAVERSGLEGSDESEFSSDEAAATGARAAPEAAAARAAPEAAAARAAPRAAAVAAAARPVAKCHWSLYISIV